jgi:hypothetical protein
VHQKEAWVPAQPAGVLPPHPHCRNETLIRYLIHFTCATDSLTIEAMDLVTLVGIQPPASGPEWETIKAPDNP